MNARLTAMGKAEGINFNFDGKVGNTRDAHRLVQLAKTKSTEAQNRLVTELFKSHFEEAGDVTSQSMLVETGGKAGLDQAEVKDWLETGRGGGEVDREVQRAYEDGVSGVPNFTINGKYRVSGAQDVEYFLKVLTAAKAQATDAGDKPAEGTSC